MSRLVGTRWFFPACVLVFTALGLESAVNGDANARVFGLTCVLVIGVGGGAAVVGGLLSPPPLRVERNPFELPDGTTHPALILPYRRYPLLARTIAAVGLIAGAAVFALAPRSAGDGAFDNVGVRTLVGLAGAYGIVAIVARLRGGLGGRDLIVLTSKGLLLTSPGASKYVAWAAIVSVERRDFRGIPTLSVALASREGVVLTGAQGILDTIGAFFDRPNRMAIPLRSLGLPPDDVVALVQRFHDQGTSTRRDGAGDLMDGGTDQFWIDHFASPSGRPGDAPLA